MTIDLDTRLWGQQPDHSWEEKSYLKDKTEGAMFNRSKKEVQFC